MGAKAEVKSMEQLEIDDLVDAGLQLESAQIFLTRLREIASSISSSQDLPAVWGKFSQTVLEPSHPHAVHHLVYRSIFKKWDEFKLGPPPAWIPSQFAKTTNLGRLMEAYGRKILGSSYRNPVESFRAFHKWSTVHPEGYLELVLDEISVVFHEQPKSILDTSDESMPGGSWLSGAVLNAAESSLAPSLKMNKRDTSLALVWRDEGADDLPVRTLNLAELRALVSRVANALVEIGFQQGDAIAIDMPMNVHAVVSYLGIIVAGMVVVSIADSFGASEIATRCRVSEAKGIITQDHILRGLKHLPLYGRVVEAKAPKAIVIPANGNIVSANLRHGDLTWDQFVSNANKVSRPDQFKAVVTPVTAPLNILFSSGTTGEPKAIPWDHLSALRCAVDSWGLMDIRCGDVVSWPTNLGWMMGPFLIFASLLNGGAIALYNGSPLGRGFGKFVQDAGITMQGTVPSLVKAWRKQHCMDNLNWSSIRAFASTGEASSLDDSLWLASRAFYKAPVLEYCGGTELASGYISGCIVQPQAFSVFSTSSLMNEFVILDENQNVYPEDEPCTGEIGLVAVNFGATNRLLNADHEKVYYTGMPSHKGKRLRRHGDVFERTIGGFYRAHGRSDDTMNLGGIKASSVEIERVCNTAHERILETAAIAISPPGGGPEELVILAVLKDGPVISDIFLKQVISSAVQKNLNPLFKVSALEVLTEFPRTASNKLMRRVLRAQLVQKQNVTSKL